MKLSYTPAQKKRASTLLALGASEYEAAEMLIEGGKYREAVRPLYFACFYIGQSFLCSKVPRNVSHRALKIKLHEVYKRHKEFPHRYLDLHGRLHEQRTLYDYRTTHSPAPRLLQRQLGVLRAYVNFAQKIVPKVELDDLLRGLVADNESLIKDLSFDIYCPKTYAHHTRITFWQPPFYLDVFSLNTLIKSTASFLKSLKVKRYQDYVVGLNSKVNQYEDNHLIMIDIDTTDAASESALKPIGGVLLKSGRGFHFIGHKVVQGQKAWKSQMRSLLRNPVLKGHIDRDHVEISLKRGYSTLRVTKSPVKTTIPYFYKEI